MRPLDHLDNLILRCGRITSCLTDGNYRLYMPDLMWCLNELSTRQLTIKAGHAHLTHLRTALRNGDAATKIAMNKDLTMWELHGKKFEEQYITSTASATPGSAGSALKSAIIDNITHTAPAPKVKAPSHCSQMAAKQIAADQAIIADLSHQLKEMTTKADAGQSAQYQLEAVVAESADLKQRFDALVSQDAENREVVVGQLCSILSMIDKHAPDHFTTAFSHKAEVFPPVFPIEDAYKRILEHGGVPYEIDFCLRMVIKYIKPLLPRCMGKVRFRGEQGTEYEQYEHFVPIYRRVCSPESETPYRKVTPYVKRNLYHSREHVLAYIAEHAAPFLEEATRICNECAFA